MIHSMTGFGKASATVDGKRYTVEIKSLNSKTMDIGMRLPAALRSKELALRSELTEKVTRGKADVVITYENIGGSATINHLNLEQISEYAQQLLVVSHQTGIALPQDWFGVLMGLPDTVVRGTEGVEELSEAAYEEVHRAYEEAIRDLTAYRAEEGKSLEKVLRDKVKNIEALLAEVDQYEGGRVQKIRERLEEQLEKLQGGFDTNRLEQELIFYIEKLDVSEEKNRLKQHLKYFVETLELEADPKEGVGKKLGFIAQEMGREINTLGSKSNQSDMQKIVVGMKDELEQIKEQVLNVL